MGGGGGGSIFKQCVLYFSLSLSLSLSVQGTVFMDSASLQPQSTQSLPHHCSFPSQHPRSFSVQDQYGQLGPGNGGSQYSKLSHTPSSAGSLSSMVPSKPISISQQRPPPPPTPMPVHMCSQCSPFQTPALMASGQIMFLSTSPCHHMHPFQASPTRTILTSYPHPMFHSAVPMGYVGKSASFDLPYPEPGRQQAELMSSRPKPGRSHSTATLY